MLPSVPGFSVVKKLGGGSVAEVFLVRSDLTQQEQVMKVLRPELLSDTLVVSRFLEEARVCESLDHPNVVKHLGVSRLPGGGLYILTRHLEGTDLARHLKENGPLTVEQWIGIAKPLCDALGYIHERGIIHRDLKPSNVFLVGGLGAKKPILIDFGVARFDSRRGERTALGVVLTTPEYSAPELIEGAEPSARSDFYAFGIMMFEVLVGHPPFSDPSPTEMFKLHLEAAPPPMPTEAAALEPVFQKCVAKNPEDRFANAAELKAALEEAMGLLVPPTGRTFMGQTPPAVPWKQEEPAVLPGEVLGSYRVERLLGEGGMGQVFLATHVRLGRNVAIKVLRPEHAGRRDLVERFFQEARSINQINHEHIVEVHDFVEDQSPTGVPRVYCIMELLAGKTLRTLLDESRLPIRRIVGIARQICDALGAAHRLGIVHRDVKPDNVFLTERSGIQDFVKVLDFGMAKFITPAGPMTSHTVQGMIVGTPGYMAPEQANGQPSDPRTDIHALGVVLYEMLTGKVPFEAESLMQLLMKIGTEPAPALGRLSASGEEIPGLLQELVGRCLEKKAEKRPQTLGEIEFVLDKIAGQPVVQRPVAPAAVTPTLGTKQRVPEPVPPAPPAAHVEPAPKVSQELKPEELRAVAAPRRTWLYGAVGGAIALAVIVYAVHPEPSRGVGNLPPQAPALAAPAATVAVPARPAPEADHPAPAAAATIQLAVVSLPPGATVRRVDSGEELGKTPLHRTLPASPDSLDLRLDLAGYKPVERTVALRADVSLDVSLAPEQAREAPKPKSGSKRRTFKDDLVDPLAE